MTDASLDRQSLQELAKKKQVIEIDEKLSAFERLVGSIENDLVAAGGRDVPADWRARTVHGELGFAPMPGIDGTWKLHAALEISMPAVCQRCLNVFEWPLLTDVNILLCVAGETLDAEQIPAGYELWEVPGETVNLIDVADEALVMALPLAATHVDMVDCVELTPSEEEHDDTNTPFASLRTLMDEESKN